MYWLFLVVLVLICLISCIVEGKESGLVNNNLHNNTIPHVMVPNQQAYFQRIMQSYYRQPSRQQLNPVGELQMNVTIDEYHESDEDSMDGFN